MLHGLKAYAHKKFQTVNTQKSEMVCFNSRTDSIPPLVYENGLLPYSGTFRHLGMFFDKNLNLHSAAEEALRPCLAGMSCIRTLAHQHQLTNCLHACLWLSKTYIIQAGMCASQIWATPYLITRS
eukprot:1145300-Pelagomonas_calceolata.AAC.2